MIVNVLKKCSIFFPSNMHIVTKQISTNGVSGRKSGASHHNRKKRNIIKDTPPVQYPVHAKHPLDSFLWLELIYA
jgi:hypothetical protein